MKGVELTFSVLGKRCVVAVPEKLDGEPPANDADTGRPPLVSGVYRITPGASEARSSAHERDGNDA
jgi:hypothetical protein